jgi:hypothetical protein
MTMTFEQFQAEVTGEAPVGDRNSRTDADGFTFINPPALIDRLKEIASWNDFARSLLDQSNCRKRWSDRQIEAAWRMVDKIDAKNAEKPAASEREKPVFHAIHRLFSSALEAGFKKPVFRAEGLKLSMAPLHGVNAGCIYVVEIEADQYLGKITVEGHFLPVRDVEGEQVEARLTKIDSQPTEAAVAYGRATGRCSCCGRELTNKLSIELGIGPICRANWGL